MARGHRLNTSIVLAAVHGFSCLFRAVFAVEPSLCRPLPTLSPSPLLSHLASVDVKQQRRRMKKKAYVIRSGRVWKKAPESDARSASLSWRGGTSVWPPRACDCSAFTPKYHFQSHSCSLRICCCCCFLVGLFGWLVVCCFGGCLFCSRFCLVFFLFFFGGGGGGGWYWSFGGEGEGLVVLTFGVFWSCLLQVLGQHAWRVANVALS